MIWDQLTSEELGQLDRNIPVILPIAATEQHGGHLPLATDRLIGEHFMRKLDDLIPQNALILPTVAVGCSDHHMSFSGSLSLNHQAFTIQVNAMVASVLHHGFNKIILFNSHGGNQAVGQTIVEDLGYKNPDRQFVLATWWQLNLVELQKVTTTSFGGTGHAGEFETSLMMVIAPELVRVSQIRKGQNQETFDWAQGDMLQGPAASYYRTMKEMTPNGVFGDPTAATETKGHRITEIVVSALKNVVSDLRTTPVN